MTCSDVQRSGDARSACLAVCPRAGLSKFGARLETLLRSPTQWGVQKFEGGTIMIEIGDVKSGARRDDAKLGPLVACPSFIQVLLRWHCMC